MYRKISQFKTNFFQLSTPPDIAVITETWLQPDVSSKELGLNNYTIYRCDRDLESTNSSTGGGVLIAIKNDLSVTNVTPVSSLDQLFLRISLSNSNLIIGVVYFQPKSTEQQFLEYSSTLDAISAKHKDCQFILLGDYNLPYITWNSNPLQYNKTNYIDPNEQACADILRNTYSSLDLCQLYPEEELHLGYAICTN